MKLSSREDIEAPIEPTFDMLCDFEGLQRQAMRRGADVRRTDLLSSIGPGMTWQASFRLRGRRRNLSLEMMHLARPDELEVAFTSGGITGTFRVDCVALSARRTRVQIGLELRPKTLSARLLVQSLKLAKSSLTKRFKLRFAEYAKFLEDRYQAGTY